MDRTLISTDGIIFREATQDEIAEMDRMYSEEKRRKQEALKKEIKTEDKEYIKSLISELENQNEMLEKHYKRLELLEKEYPYRKFGRLDLDAVIGYTKDTISSLKRVLESTTPR